MNNDLIPHQIITLISLTLGLLCIYLSSYSGLFSIISAVLFTVLGSNTLRYVGKYSLGTGVPSVIYMLVSLGLLVNLMSIAIAFYLQITLILPLAVIFLSAIFAIIISLICKHIFKIEVEILTQSFIKITLSGALSILAISTLICGGYDYNLIFDKVISTGFIILVTFMIIMIIQNPYNACMGPNEDQYRTLCLALTETFMMLGVISIISMMYQSLWYVYLAISIILMIYFLHKYIKSCTMQAASIKYYGLWADGDEGDY